MEVEYITKNGIIIKIPEEHKNKFKIGTIIIEGDLDDIITSDNSRAINHFHPNIGRFACFGDFFGRKIIEAPALVNIFKTINLDSAFENEAKHIANEIFQKEVTKQGKTGWNL